MICAHGLRFYLKLNIVYCPTPGIASNFNDIFLLLLNVYRLGFCFYYSMWYSFGPGPNNLLTKEGLFCCGNFMPELCFEGYFYISYDPTAGVSFFMSSPRRSPCGIVICIVVRVSIGLYLSGPGIYVLHFIYLRDRKNLGYLLNENLGLALVPVYSSGLYWFGLGDEALP